jgi:hypothetical protein
MSLGFFITYEHDQKTGGGFVGYVWFNALVVWGLPLQNEGFLF